MIDRIIRFSIYNKLLISLGVVFLISWGIYSFSQLPIGAVPDITDNQVQVITTSPSLAAQEVERLITFPLEMEFGNIPKVENIRSISRFGLSVITVVFEEDMDIFLARQLIGERIEAAQENIPEGLGSPEMGPITTGLGEIYQYVIYPKEGFEEKYSPTELRSIQDWTIKRQLVGVKGVIEVNSSGGYLKQYEIAINPGKLKSLDLDLSDVYKAVASNNANTGGSYIEKEHYTYFIRGEGLLKNQQDIENIPVKNLGNIPILVKDIATVKIGHAPRFGAVSMNGIGEVVAGQVMMLKGENAASVTHRVKERMEQIKKTLPEGIIVEPYLDRTKLVNQTTKTVATNLIEGGLIVIFVLVLLLGNIRAGLIVASVIPLSMLFAVSMMRIFGVSANLMSLGAIDFGLIVDGAVIIVEAIMHHLGLRQKGMLLSQEDMDDEVFSAATRIRKSAAFGEIIILIVYLPILFLTGVEGKMFRPMAQTVSFAILGALILSLTYVPMMAALFLNKAGQNETKISQKIMDFIRRYYKPILRFSLKNRVPILIGVVLLFVLSIWRLDRMGGEFIPTLEEGDFALHQILPPGSSLAQGVEVSAPLQNILMENFPEVEKVITKIGTAEIPTDIMPLEAGDIYVIMKPKSEWETAKTREGMFRKMEEEMEKFPGVVYEFTQPIQMRFNELMTGIRQDIAIKIYGEELGILNQKAKEAEALISTLPGVGDIQVEPTAGLQQMAIHYDRRKLAKYGLNIKTINRIVNGSFAGEKAGVLYEGEKRFDIVVRMDEAFRQDIENLRNVYIPLASGGSIPLVEVADVNFEEGPIQISRENTQRRITIGVNARDVDVLTLVESIQNTLDANLNLPPGYYIRYGGQFENLQRASARLNLVVPLALALIFLLLYITFGSVSQSILIFTAIPMSAIGGIWAMTLRDMPFSISAGVGFIALFGVSVLNGIVLIGYLNQLKKEGVSDIKERIFKGTNVRVRPVIMTAAVASLGFLPMAVSRAAGAEVQQPLATVVIGGLISSTILTLIVLPILYYLFERKTWAKFFNSKAVCFTLLFATGLTVQAQQVAIDQETAVQIALNNHPKMKAAQSNLRQQKAFESASQVQTYTNIFISGEEFDLENKGIQSFGLMQTLNLPKVKNSSVAIARERIRLAQSQVELSEKELAREVAKAYDHWTFLLQKLKITQDMHAAYTEFQKVSEIRFESGDIGKIPQLAAQTKRKEGEIQLRALASELEMASIRFNSWLFSDTLFAVRDSFFEALPEPSTSDLEKHPYWETFVQAQKIAVAQIDFQKSKLLPQIQLGGRLQSVAGAFPFYGYQVGLNIPLFAKAQKAKIEASKIEAEKKGHYLNLQREQFAVRKELLFEQLQLEIQKSMFLEKELLPNAQEHESLSMEAYRQGEIDYPILIQSIDQHLKTRLDLLNSQLKAHRLYAELLFWE